MTMKKKFKIITKGLPKLGISDDFEYMDFADYDDAFSYCFKKARKEQCNKVELYECTDASMPKSRLCGIAEFYHC